MGRFFFMCYFLLSGFSTYAQQEHFLYLETESRAPFYVRIGEQTFSSTRNGFLTIPRLKDSAYQLTIGLPGNRLPDLQFTLQMNGDKGFELKPGQDARLALFDWRANNWNYPQNKGVTSEAQIDYSSMRTDAYSSLLAGIVDDSAVLYKTIVPVEETKAVAEASTSTILSDTIADAAEPTTAGIESATLDSPSTTRILPPGSLTEDPGPGLKDSLTAVEVVEKGTAPETLELSGTDTLSGDSRNSPGIKVAEAEPARASPAPATIQLLSDKRVKEGREMVFIDQSASAADTIHISIPIEVKREVEVLTEQPIVNADSALTVNASSSQPDQDSQETVKPVIAGINPSSSSGSAKLVMINSDCRRFATNAEIDKLRVAMLKEEGDAERLKAAAKVFKTRCFTVQQVKALSELFSDNDGRFNFFEAVYPYVSDSGNFRYLEEFLDSDFYRARFRSLLPGSN